MRLGPMPPIRLCRLRTKRGCQPSQLTKIEPTSIRMVSRPLFMIHRIVRTPIHRPILQRSIVQPSYRRSIRSSRKSAPCRLPMMTNSMMKLRTANRRKGLLTVAAVSGPCRSGHRWRVRLSNHVWWSEFIRPAAGDPGQRRAEQGRAAHAAGRSDCEQIQLRPFRRSRPERAGGGARREAGRQSRTRAHDHAADRASRCTNCVGSGAGGGAGRPNPPSALGEPRRVRTVPIRPDQPDSAARPQQSAGRQQAAPMQIAPMPPPPQTRQPTIVAEPPADVGFAPAWRACRTTRSNQRVAARSGSPSGAGENAPLSLSPDSNNAVLICDGAARTRPAHAAAAPARVGRTAIR